MSLTLSIRNVASLDNGMPVDFVLNRRGAMIGRAATCEWSLPDPRNYISSRHAEVTYREGFYLFTDLSTNGTFLNGAGERMAGPRRIETGDLFLIGHYEITASLTGEALAAVERHGEQSAAEAHRQGGWGWEAAGGGGPPPAPSPGGWGAPGGDTGWGAPPEPTGDGWGAPPASDGWAAPDQPGWAPQVGPSLSTPAPYAPRGGDAGPPRSGPMDSGNSWAPPPQAPEARAPSPWDSALPPAEQSSGWSSAAPDRPRAATPNDIWGSMENSNVVDWARANFGQKPEGPSDPLGLNKRPADALPRELPRAPAAPPEEPVGWGAPAAPAAPAASPTAGGWASPVAPTPAPPPPAHPAQQPPPPASIQPDIGHLLAAFATAAGLQPEQVKQPSPEMLTRAGDLLRRLASGLVVMVEARARAKSQLGAEQTRLEFDGNNPIKFARSPDQALAALLNPPERGFMPAERAIEDAYHDLQSHQMATLKAMQGALRATLDRFSPAAIKQRAETGGFLTRLLPGGREATLWATYEREFSGVAQGSDEAFMDVFAKEFRQAYEAQSRKRS